MATKNKYASEERVNPAYAKFQQKPDRNANKKKILERMKKDHEKRNPENPDKE